MTTTPPSDTAPSPAAAALPGAKEVVPFQVGELVGQRYRVDSLLGEDTLGWLYEVSELNATASGDGLGTPLYLRLLRPRFGEGGVALPAEAQKLWRGQLSLLRDLRHPGVVPVHETCLGDEQGRVYAVRAAVEQQGQSLYALLQTWPGGLPEPEAVRLCAAIAEAIEAAHQRGVLHLSLSPKRIFVMPSTSSRSHPSPNSDAVVVKVADFALLPPQLSARYCEPGYLSPEQIEGQPCDRRTDQFALAVIFYEMLSGQPAFIGAPDEERQTILNRVIGEDPLPLALSRPIELALARALSRSRAVRFPGLSDFVCALGVDGVAWTAVRPPGPARSQFSPPPARRAPLYIPVLLGALAAIAALSVYALLAHRFGTRTTASLSSSPAARGPQKPDSAGDRPVPGPAPADDRALSPVIASNRTGLPAPAAGTQPNVLPVSAPPHLSAAVSAQSAVPSAGSPTKLPPKPPIAAPAPGYASAPFSEAELRVTTDGPPLSPAHLGRIKYCLALIHPRAPFTVVLENINGTLYVGERTTATDIRLSNDFRNCLKNEVQGNIEPKDVYIKGILKGRAAP